MSHIHRHTLLLKNEVRLGYIHEEYEARFRALGRFKKMEDHIEDKSTTLLKRPFVRALIRRSFTDSVVGCARWLQEISTFVHCIEVGMGTVLGMHLVRLL